MQSIYPMKPWYTSAVLVFIVLFLYGCQSGPTIKLVDYSSIRIPIIYPKGTLDDGYNTEDEHILTEVSVVKTKNSCSLPTGVSISDASKHEELWFKLRNTTLIGGVPKSLLIVTARNKIKWERLAIVEDAFLKMASTPTMERFGKDCLQKGWKEFARQRIVSSWPSTFSDWLKYEYGVDPKNRTADLKHGMSLCFYGAVQTFDDTSNVKEELAAGGGQCFPISLHFAEKAYFSTLDLDSPIEVPYPMRGSLNTFFDHQWSQFPATNGKNYAVNSMHFHTFPTQQRAFYRIFYPDNLPYSQFPEPFQKGPVVVATSRADMLDAVTLCALNKPGGLKQICGLVNSREVFPNLGCLINKPTEKHKHLARCAGDVSCIKEWNDFPPLCFVTRIQGQFHPEITVTINGRVQSVPVGTQLLQLIQGQADLEIDSIIRAESIGTSQWIDVDEILKKATRSLSVHRFFEGSYVQVVFNERTRETLSIPLKHGDLVKW